MDVSEWLRGLGLDQYAPAFRENKITPDLLPSLTAEDLKELGVGSVGDRRRLLSAIAALAPASAVEPVPPFPKSVAKQEAERRQVTILFCDRLRRYPYRSRLISPSCIVVEGTTQKVLSDIAHPVA